MSALPQAMRQRGCELLEYRSATGSACGRAPVVLVHGYAATSGVWMPLRTSLFEAGFDRVLVLRYDTIGLDVPDLARFLSDNVTAVANRTGCAAVHLVGHSLGGLIIRFAVEQCGFGCDVATVVTIATPHRGSPLAWVGPGVTARRMRPGSSLLGEPKPGGARGREVRYVNFYCARDSVVPQQSARLECSEHPDHISNLRIEAAGHLGAASSAAVLSALPAELLASEHSRSALAPSRACVA